MKYIIFLSVAFVYFSVKLIQTINAASQGKIKFIRGIPDLEKGMNVNMILSNNQIRIDDKLIIPLDKVKNAIVFQVRQVSLDGKGLVGKAAVKPSLLKKAWIILCSIITAKKLTFFSIDFIDAKGQKCNGLFITDSYRYMREFTDSVNKKSTQL